MNRMKNSTVKLIVWSVIAVLILGIMLALFFTPSIFKNLNIIFPFSSVNYYSNSENYQVGAGSADGVKSIRIEWIDGKIEVVPGSGTSVEFSEDASGSLSEDQQLHWYNDNGTLYLRYAASGVRLLGNLNKTLKVTVPEGLTLDELKIDAVSADTEIGEIRADTLDVDGVSGRVGSDGAFREVKLDSVSGNVTLRFQNPNGVPEKIDSDSVSGNMSLFLPEGTGFSARIDSVSGDISTDFALTQMSKKQIVCGDGKLVIDIESVSGDLEIRKAG